MRPASLLVVKLWPLVQNALKTTILHWVDIEFFIKKITWFPVLPND
jgi:hypothetical protein